MTESSFERKVLRLCYANLTITVLVAVFMALAFFAQRSEVYAELKRFEDFRVERLRDHAILDRNLEQFNRARIRMEEGYHEYIEKIDERKQTE